MLKLRIIQPGLPDEVLTFERDYAVLGRKKEQGVDVVINQPFVSARHAIVLKGTVIIDQGSSNGTFVDGQRIREPALVRTSFTLGRDDVRIVVDEDERADDDRTSLPNATARPQAAGPVSNTRDSLAELKRRNAELEARIAQLESRAAENSARFAAAEKLGSQQGALPNSRADSNGDFAARLAEQSETIRKLRAEIDAARNGP